MIAIVSEVYWDAENGRYICIGTEEKKKCFVMLFTLLKNSKFGLTFVGLTLYIQIAIKEF